MGFAAMQSKYCISEPPQGAEYQTPRRINNLGVCCSLVVLDSGLIPL
jgi:hypothetical protein